MEFWAKVVMVLSSLSFLVSLCLHYLIDQWRLDELEKRYDELSEEDKLSVARARKIERFLSQPFFVAEVFTGSPGKYVPLSETIRGFRGIVDGEYDHLPEQAFYMVGTIDEAVKKGEDMAKKAA